MLVEEILPIAQIASIGAFIIACIPIAISICICTTSLVVRVIRLGVVKRFISLSVKVDILSNSFERKVFAKLAAMCEENHPVAIAAMLPNAQSNIMPPFFHTSFCTIAHAETAVVSFFV